MEYVGLNQEYPETAIQWKQQGVITFEFTISNYGFVEDITEENIIPVGYNLENEGMRLLKKLQRFEPERLNGKAIPVRFRMPYVFILQE
jgi:outer membrane biosynthesis protein TonB